MLPLPEESDQVAHVVAARQHGNVIDADGLERFPQPAFALPGGKVAVYTGILPITKDENGSHLERT